MEGFKNTNQNLEKESLEKFEKEDNFVFLSEEELNALNESERSIYYRKLEERAESEQKEYYQNDPEITQEKLDELYQGKNDNTEEFDKYTRIKNEQKKPLNPKSKNKKRKFKQDNSLEGIYRRYNER